MTNLTNLGGAAEVATMTRRTMLALPRRRFHRMLAIDHGRCGSAICTG
jgi:hypothetical protein